MSLDSLEGPYKPREGETCMECHVGELELDSGSPGSYDEPEQPACLYCPVCGAEYEDFDDSD